MLESALDLVVPDSWDSMIGDDVCDVRSKHNVEGECLCVLLPYDPDDMRRLAFMGSPDVGTVVSVHEAAEILEERKRLLHIINLKLRNVRDYQPYGKLARLFRKKFPAAPPPSLEHNLSPSMYDYTTDQCFAPTSPSSLFPAREPHSPTYIPSSPTFTPSSPTYMPSSPTYIPSSPTFAPLQGQAHTTVNVQDSTEAVTTNELEIDDQSVDLIFGEAIELMKLLNSK